MAWRWGGGGPPERDMFRRERGETIWHFNPELCQETINAKVGPPPETSCLECLIAGKQERKRSDGKGRRANAKRESHGGPTKPPSSPPITKKKRRGRISGYSFFIISLAPRVII